MHAWVRLENHVFKCWGQWDFTRARRNVTRVDSSLSQKLRLFTHPHLRGILGTRTGPPNLGDLALLQQPERNIQKLGRGVCGGGLQYESLETSLFVKDNAGLKSISFPEHRF